MSYSVKPRSLISALLVFAFLFLILFINIRSFFNFYDEGFAVFDATRVMNGEVPYRDFWVIYPPAQFFVIAGVFKVFGAQLVHARLYDTLVRFLLLIGVYLVTKKVASHRLALLATLAAGFLLASVGFYSYAVFPALGLGVWAIFFWLKDMDGRRKGGLALSGTLLGFAALFRLDIGMYAAAGILAAAYLFYLSQALQPKEGSEPGQMKRFSVKMLLSPLKTLAWVAAPFAAITLLGYGILSLRSGWDNIYEQLFHFPATIFHSVRWLAYPSLVPSDFPPSNDWFRFYLPILTLGFAVAAPGVMLMRKRAAPEPWVYGAISLVIYGALLFNQALSRYDLIHVTPASILTFMVSAVLVARYVPEVRFNGLKIAAYLLMGGLAMLYIFPSFKNLLATLDFSPPWGCFSHLEKASCAPLDPNQEQAVQYIQAHTQPTDPIFVGNLRHDRIFVSDVGFYYLADRPCATRYHELHPGVATTLPVQQTIAAEIEAKRVKMIVLVDMWESNEPNGSSQSSGVYFLDDYLRAHYLHVTTFGNYQIWERK